MSEKSFTREEVAQAIANSVELSEKPDWTSYIYHRLLAIAREVTANNPHIFQDRVDNQRIYWNGEEISLIIFAMINDVEDKRSVRSYRYKRLGVTPESLRVALNSLLSGKTTEFERLLAARKAAAEDAKAAELNKKAEREAEAKKVRLSREEGKAAFIQKCNDALSPILEAVNKVYADGNGSILTSGLTTLDYSIELRWEGPLGPGNQRGNYRIAFKVHRYNMHNNFIPKVEDGSLVVLFRSKLLTPRKNDDGSFSNVVSLDDPDWKERIEEAIVELIDSNNHFNGQVRHEPHGYGDGIF